MVRSFCVERRVLRNRRFDAHWSRNDRGAENESPANDPHTAHVGSDGRTPAGSRRLATRFVLAASPRRETIPEQSRVIGFLFQQVSFSELIGTSTIAGCTIYSPQTSTTLPTHN